MKCVLWEAHWLDAEKGFLRHWAECPRRSCDSYISGCKRRRQRQRHPRSIFRTDSNGKHSEHHCQEYGTGTKPLGELFQISCIGRYWQIMFIEQNWIDAKAAETLGSNWQGEIDDGLNKTPRPMRV